MPFDWSQWTPPANATPTTLASFWGEHMPSITEARNAYYKENFYDPMAALRGQYSSWAAPTWEGSSAWQAYTGYQSNMEQLLARIGAGPQASDLSQANADVAQLYGFSPASWTALQSSIGDLVNASNVMARAGNIATEMQNSAFGQQQTQAMRVAERQATDAVGKQLEAIFGERGGLAGFQAAYDMTSQLQSTFMQQAAQNSLAMFDKAVASVNAENGYYQELIQRGAVQAQDYLNLRWNALQQGYSDYATAMNQALQQWTTQEQVSKDQWQAAQATIGAQIDALDRQLASEMGLDQNTLDMITAAYADAAKTTDSGTSEAFTKFGEAAGGTLKLIGAGLVTAGLTASPIGWPLAILGGVMWLIGGIF